MKRIFVILLTFVLSITMSACGSLGKPDITVSNSDEITSLTDSFKGTMTPQQALDELKGLDLSGKKVKYSGLEYEKVTDDENGTAVTYYLKDGVRTYAVYDGYGEDCVDFYTKTNSGYDATVKYIFPGTDNASADVTFEINDYIYNVSYESINSSVYYGAESIYITVTRKGETFDEYLTYSVCFTDKEYSADLVLARYIDENGAYRSLVSGEDDDIIVEKLNSEIEICDIPSEDLTNTEILMGPHKAYIGENNEIYIETTLLRLFSEDAGIDEFVKEYDFTKGKDVDDEVDLAYKDVALKFSDNCEIEGYENVYDFVTAEWNDYVYMSVSFNESGEISNVTAGTLSYY